VIAMVLGGTGFLGRHISEAFARAGWDVVVVSRGPVTGELPARRVRLDLADASVPTIAALIRAERPSVVVNAMGLVWKGQAEQMLAVNGTAVERIVDGVATVPDRPHLVQIGSVREYGLVPRGQTIDAGTALAPDHPYGRTKVVGSRAVLRAVELGRLSGTVIRMTNLIGPGAPIGSLVGSVAYQLQSAAREQARAVIRTGSLSALRDFVDVRDTADAVLAAVEAEAIGEVINVGSGNTVAARRPVQTLIEISGVPTEFIEDTSQSPPGGEETWHHVDIGPAARLLGWAPARSLAESLRDLWNDMAPMRW